MPSIGIGISRVIKGSGLNQTVEILAPTDLILTVINDTSIKLDFTVTSTGQDGHSIERSTDGVNYAEIDTVSGATATYTDTTGADGTRYYYRVKAYAGAVYSDPCTAANDWCAIKMVLTSAGNGTYVSTIRFWFDTTNVVVTLDGNGKWYSDSGGTADESASYTFVAGALRTRYLKVTSGVSNMLMFAKGNWTKWGESPNFGLVSNSNGVTISKDISSITSLTTIALTDYANLSGSVAALTGLTFLRVEGSNTLSGSVAALTGLTFLRVEGSNTLSGSVAALTGLTVLYVLGSNTLSGDIGGSGINAMVNGITSISIGTTNHMDTYTSGATWTLVSTSNINPAVGYGYSSTEIDNILIDMAASLGTVTAMTITLKGSSAARTSASDAAVTTLNGKGWTIVTN